MVRALFTLCIICSLIIQNVSKISHMNVNCTSVVVFFCFPSLFPKLMPIIETALEQDGESATLRGYRPLFIF